MPAISTIRSPANGPTAFSFPPAPTLSASIYNPQVVQSTLRHVTLDDKYQLESGRIYLNGTQALVRLLMLQRQRDRGQGLNTAGFVSGYRGSPLGSLDQQLWRAAPFLSKADIVFQPGVNEDLTATAIWGTQQLGLFPGARVDGVFALWYGKAPGVDRSGDPMRHGNNAGTAPQGGVLVLAGDDHAAKSSTVASHTELAFVDLSMPVLYPADITEIIDYGLYAWSLSRVTGSWVVMKLLPENTDCAMSVAAEPSPVDLRLPADVDLPAGGFNIRLPDSPLEQEERLLRYRMPALRACLAAHALDRTIIAAPRKRLAIVTSGKTYLDVMQSLRELGLDEVDASEIGLAVYKVAVVWPLDVNGVAAFACGAESVLVIEEKRAVIETQLKEHLYGRSDAERPAIIGKRDEHGAPLVPDYGELDPVMLARIIGARVSAFHRDERVRENLQRLDAHQATLSSLHPVLERVPYFCSGCPHNTSTKVPEGSRALAGIGCHYMAQWMDRDTATFTHMGGEGASWIGQAAFTETQHVFVNIGDGTYTHSGSLAIRAAVIAGVNVTYKLLYNDAVAMTGGQPIDGQVPIAKITHQLYGEGVRRIIIVTDEVDRYNDRGPLAAGVTVHDRRDLDREQRRLREAQGVSVLIYDQTCAAEKRRRRKRALMDDPARRIFINELVCEGCGDCSTQSNCLAVVPLETEFGRKRRIDQSNCNKDFSCVEGFCPSFVSVVGGELKKPILPADLTAGALLPEPERATVHHTYNVLVTGVGGSGVVTIGNILGMAAHLEGRYCTVLDQTGLAQKYGAVMSHIRIADAPGAIFATRIVEAGADVVIGCDLVTAASRDGVKRLASRRSAAVLNTESAVVSEFTRDSDVDFSTPEMIETVRKLVDKERVDCLPASAWVTRLLGDSIGTNMFMVGYAYQRGLIPMSATAIERAIAINAVAVDFNEKAFRLGRLAAHDRAQVEHAATSVRDVGPPNADISKNLDEVVERRESFLTEYQDAAYAARYHALVERAREAEAACTPGRCGVADAVARAYFKLLAYKDEYEVARLYTASGFLKRLKASFTGGSSLRFHLAPPLLSRRDPRTGRYEKRTFGPWIIVVFRLLSALKWLRGGPFDVFGYLPERRLERTLIREYESMAVEMLEALDQNNHEYAVQLLALPHIVRGFGIVKERNVERYRAERATLMGQFEAADRLRAAG